MAHCQDGGNIYSYVLNRICNYLIHFPFEAMAYDIFAMTSLPDWCKILLSAILIFFVVGLIVKLLWQFKPTRKLVA